MILRLLAQANDSRYWQVGGVDSAWVQYKLEARKMLENAAESPASSARFVGRRNVAQDSLPAKDLLTKD